MKFLTFLVTVIFSLNTFAGLCTIHYKRTACEGKEKESYAKCAGIQECDEKKKADDEAACQKLAKEACANSRLDITKLKVITAKFGDKPLLDGTNADFCISYEKRDTEFNKCK